MTNSKGAMSGSTKKTEPCKKEACAIQKCLQVHKYQQHLCDHILEAMRACCERLGKEDSICCSGFRTRPPSATTKSSPG